MRTLQSHKNVIDASKVFGAGWKKSLLFGTRGALAVGGIEKAVLNASYISQSIRCKTTDELTEVRELSVEDLIKLARCVKYKLDCEQNGVISLVFAAGNNEVMVDIGLNTDGQKEANLYLAMIDADIQLNVFRG